MLEIFEDSGKARPQREYKDEAGVRSAGCFLLLKQIPEIIKRECLFVFTVWRVPSVTDWRSCFGAVMRYHIMSDV